MEKYMRKKINAPQEKIPDITGITSCRLNFYHGHILAFVEPVGDNLLGDTSWSNQRCYFHPSPSVRRIDSLSSYISTSGTSCPMISNAFGACCFAQSLVLWSHPFLVALVAVGDLVVPGCAALGWPSEHYRTHLLFLLQLQTMLHALTIYILL